ncbi:NUDIX hydrolase [Chitinophaga pendula]|uniref:NUDIX domain-containing protein n=1 Tax=Chitinophaga TaxID=79328 RepID=UPI000BB0B4D4|nr:MULTISPECIES: NUDIX hydrolase [Chitinophaga]ASZ13755.1 DNA mismatch repair protein MutT [Chitinophaga sp. MD30]UCJ08626.1 NUDIX hydrolase [Chitinophaga pendula]
MNMTENPWQILSGQAIYDNKWISLTEHQVINPAGGRGIYGVVHFKHVAVGVVVVDEARNIYLVGQYRFPLEQYSWEIPAGGAPLGEDTLDAGKRELLEETGLVAQRWEPILQMHLSNSISDEVAIIYLARELEQHSPQPEDTEQLVIKKVPFEEAYRQVQAGMITDSMSVAGILQLRLMQLEGRW